MFPEQFHSPSRVCNKSHSQCSSVISSPDSLSPQWDMSIEIWVDKVHVMPQLDVMALL